MKCSHTVAGASAGAHSSRGWGEGMDDLKSVAQVNRLNACERELAEIRGFTGAYFQRRRKYLLNQISRLHFELGQYELTGLRAQ
jgi:hypothetical protein